jgi:aminoglycoside phosphotransferase (APT) family kinase protein
VPVFSHNDLGIEHVLIDPGTWTVTGIIDWSDAAIVDPAIDFGLLYGVAVPCVDHHRDPPTSSDRAPPADGSVGDLASFA